MPWHTWEEQGCNGVCTALGLGGCSCLNPCVSVGMQQCSGSGSRVGLFEEDRLVPMLTDTCYPKQSKGMLTLPTLHGRELCFLQG